MFTMKPHEIRGHLVLAQKKIKDLAEELGVSQPAVHQVINGQRPNPRIRRAIADAIDRPVEEVWSDGKGK